MAAGPDTLLRYIRGLVLRPESDEVSDAALLGRFIMERDETAFAALVVRHGPLVLHVCQRVLGDVHDAEDAFQAAFLVLARKAATVRHPEALPAWLHGVARRAALKARLARTRQFREMGPLVVPAVDPRPDPLVDLSVRELLVIIDSELERLPEVYRLPVILCCLEGRSLEEAARQLGWTPGSVKGRLERGRKRLHDRLVRRGLTLSAALAAAEVSRGAASAAVVARLVAATARGAMLFAARSTTAGEVSAEAAALAGNVIKGMALARLTIPATLLLATCLLATGFLTYQLASSPPTAAETRTIPLSSRGQSQSSLPEAPRDLFDAPIEVTGRVLNPEGTPVAGANLYVGYSPRPSHFAPSRPPAAYLFRATSAADGRFHFTFARSELDAKLLDASRPAVVAVASGYGPDWAVIGDSAEGVELSLKLVKDLPVNGRILDQNRKPVANAKIRVETVLSAPEEDVTRYLKGDLNSWFPKVWMGSLPGQPVDLTTDADGRFSISGVGRDRIVRLVLEGPSIHYTVFESVTLPSPATPDSGGIRRATFGYVARPSRSIRGVVRDKATGRPVAGVKMSVQWTDSTALTDSDGRFEILGCPKLQQSYFVMAEPQSGQPYFAASASVSARAGPDPLTVNFDLVSGIPLSGRVMDQSTRKPPRTAVVDYYPLFPNAHSSKITNGFLAASSTVIRPDGSFSLVVLPGPGVVCVAASPRNSYAVARVDDKELANLFIEGINHGDDQCPGTTSTAVGAVGRGILHVNKYNVLSLINPDARAESLALELTLQPARTLQGTVVRPDGQSLTGVRVIGLTAMADYEILESASFTITGLNPQLTRNLFFLHRGENLGKVLTIHGHETRPLRVQLEPCGTVIGRLVDKAGKPVRGVNVGFCRPVDGYIFLNTATNVDGRFRMVGLVPGAKYSLTSSRPLRKELGQVEVESGRSKDLGDLPVAD